MANDLADVLSQYRTLASALSRSRDRVIANPWSEEAKELGVLAKKTDTGSRKAAAESHFASTQQALLDAFIVKLVAAFEAAAFRKLATRIGEARSTLAKHHDALSIVQRLVKDKDEVRDLKGLEKLLQGDTSLAALREHRNLVAHGGRIGQLSTFATAEDVHDALVDLLEMV